MRVSTFMVPFDKVVKCSESDSIEKALDLLLEKKISAVVVVAHGGIPCGIVTKTDFVAAYRAGINVSEKVSRIMIRELDTLNEMEHRDRAAALFEKQGRHHALVVNAAGAFVGLISAWDIAAECARDGRAWPWTRTPDGKIQAAH